MKLQLKISAIALILSISFNLARLAAQHSELFGVIAGGGEYSHGAIYKTDKNGNNFSVIYSFPPVKNEGEVPQGSLCYANKEKLYGTTSQGGKYGYGVLYEWDIPTSTFNKRIDFSGNDTVSNPIGSLIHEDNGRLIGMAGGSGDNYNGVIYEWDPVTNLLSKKYEFLTREEGSGPIGPLVQATNGKIYGVTFTGGEFENGVLFRWDPLTDTYTKMVEFDGPEKGSRPSGPLIMGDSGKFYGITSNGGINQSGVIFEWDPGTETFTKKLDRPGSRFDHPVSSLVRAVNGKFYGIDNTGAIFEWDITTNTYTIKTRNGELSSNSVEPGKVSLMMAGNGKIYGTIYSLSYSEHGILFEWNPLSNALKIVPFPYGSYPSGGLTEVDYTPPGTLYADICDSYTSPSGNYTWNCSGTYPDTIPGSNGADSIITVYLTVRHRTSSTISVTDCKSYVSPSGKVWTSSGVYYDTIPNVQECDSIITVNLTIQCNEIFGMTYKGGDYNNGTIYKTDGNGDNLTTLYSFPLESEGCNPMGSFVQVSDSTLYGTTFNGGKYGHGVIFEWNIPTQTFTRKADFNAITTGSHPKGAMVMAENGKLIGLTGLTRDGAPVLFEWDPSINMLSRKYEFISNGNAILPAGNIVKAKDGKLYGMTINGGVYNAGEIYEWDPFNNVFIPKIDFDGQEMGGYPAFSLSQADNGKFYGITSKSGYGDAGKIFEWDPVTNNYSGKYNFPGNIYRYLSSGLIQDDNSRFFGRLTYHEGEGTIFVWDTTTNSIKYYSPNTPYDLFVSHETESSLLLASNRKMYGTGSGGILNGKGTLFEWDPATKIFEIKHYFNTSDLSTPSGGVIEVPCLQTATIHVSACNSYTSPSGKYVWNISGIYQDTLNEVTGCNTILTIHLTINPVPVINLEADTTIYTDQDFILGPFTDDYNYLWSDGSENPYFEISGSDLGSGNHQIAVIVSDTNGCNISDTVTISVVPYSGIHFNKNNNPIRLFPNPTSGSFTIDLNKAYSNVTIAITEFDGRIIQMENSNNAKTINLKMDAEPGIYLVTITTVNDRAVFKIMKK